MTLEEVKNIHKKVIERLELDKEVKDIVLKFVGGYDGTHQDDFDRLLLTLEGLLVSNKTLQIKSDSYDQLKRIKEKYEQEIRDLLEAAEDFKNVDTANLPVVSDDTEEQSDDSS